MSFSIGVEVNPAHSGCNFVKIYPVKRIPGGISSFIGVREKRQKKVICIVTWGKKHFKKRGHKHFFYPFEFPPLQSFLILRFCQHFEFNFNLLDSMCVVETISILIFRVSKKLSKGRMSLKWYIGINMEKLTT